MLLRRSIKLASVAGMLGASLTAGGCADDGASLHVVCPIQPEIEENVCIFDPGSDACVLEGVMNLASAERYITGLRLESGLVARESDIPPRAETNGIQLKTAEVELRLPGGAPLVFNEDLPNPFELEASGYVPPGGSGIMSLTLVPPLYAAQLRELERNPATALGQLVIAIKVKGRTDGSGEVETDEWTWPVRLSYRSPVYEDGVCRRFEDGYCNAGIDDFEDACACSSEAVPSCKL